MDQLQKLFEKVIGLPPRQEGHGRELQTLEGVLKVGGRGRVEIGLKDKTASTGQSASRMSLPQMPNLHSDP